nr:hypothetical protein StreXyl84_49840 [Streptomyces sp. Xyl84]
MRHRVSRGRHAGERAAGESPANHPYAPSHGHTPGLAVRAWGVRACAGGAAWAGGPARAHAIRA